MNIQLPCLVRLTTAPRHASPRRCPLSLGLSGSMARCVLVIPFVAADFNVLLSLMCPCVRLSFLSDQPSSPRSSPLLPCLKLLLPFLYKDLHSSMVVMRLFDSSLSSCNHELVPFPIVGIVFVFLRVLFGSRSSCSTDYKNVSLATAASDLLPCERHFAFLPQIALVLLLRCLASSRKLPLFTVVSVFFLVAKIL